VLRSSTAARGVFAVYPAGGQLLLTPAELQVRRAAADLTAIDYTAGIWLERVPAGPRKKALLILSLSANLGFLGFFKYYNFLASNVALLLAKPSHSFWLEIVLPLGISFHTFQSMSYVVDVYRGEQKAVRSPIDYALFILLLPATWWRDRLSGRTLSSGTFSIGGPLRPAKVHRKMNRALRHPDRHVREPEKSK